MDAKFANGLLGHRVEVKVSHDSEAQILTVIDKVNMWEIDQNPDGCKFAVQSDVYMVIDEAGVVDRIAPHTIVRVILPVNEPSITSEQWEKLLQREHPLAVPAEPYSIATVERADRFRSEVLIPNGFTDWSCRSNLEGIISWAIVDKNGHRIRFDLGGVYLVEPNGHLPLYPNLPRLPINEWVKNPTIEALMPPKDN